MANPSSVHLPGFTDPVEWPPGSAPKPPEVADVLARVAIHVLGGIADIGRVRRERDLYREQAALFAEALIETGDAGADVVSALLTAQETRA